MSKLQVIWVISIQVKAFCLVKSLVSISLKHALVKQRDLIFCNKILNAEIYGTSIQQELENHYKYIIINNTSLNRQTNHLQILKLIKNKIIFNYKIHCKKIVIRDYNLCKKSIKKLFYAKILFNNMFQKNLTPSLL